MMRQSLPRPTTNSMKVGVVNRVFSKLIDIIVVFLIALLVVYPVGPLVGFLYSLLADGMNFGPFRGQSIGKKIFRLSVVSTQTRKKATWKESALRNSPVGLATFFAIIPVWGWLFLILIGLPLMLMEIYLMVTVESGHRLGDVMGDTEVIEIPRRSGV